MLPPPPAASPPKVMREVELLPDGAAVRVTNENKGQFIELAARRRLIRGADAELQALAKVGG
jgi:hypothetical protein